MMMNDDNEILRENDSNENEKDKGVASLVEKPNSKREAHTVSFDEENEMEDVSITIDEENPPTLNSRKSGDDELSDSLTMEKEAPLPDGVKSMEIDDSHNLKEKAPRRCCVPAQKFGNMSVISPWLYNRTGLGILGPAYVGAIVTLVIFSYASQYFARKAMHIGTWSFVTCIAFSIVTIVSLFFVSCADPGIVKGGHGQGGGSHGYEGIPSQEIDLSEWRYCDLCSLPQPPDAVHCAECNLCVEGYDHFCIWMGTAIGKKNFRAFLIFNISWFTYLIYGGLWVCLIGPRVLL